MEKARTNLAHSFSYHPQTNGQIEIINKVSGNLLRCLIKKYGKSWEQVIPQAKFAYNDIKNITTGLLSVKLTSIQDTIQQDGFNDLNMNVEMPILTDSHNIISKEEKFWK